MRGRIKVDRRFLTCMKIRVSPLLSFLSFMATDPISNSTSPKSNAWTITHCSFLLLHHLYEIPLLPPSLSNLSVTTLPHYLLNTHFYQSLSPAMCFESSNSNSAASRSSSRPSKQLRQTRQHRQGRFAISVGCIRGGPCGCRDSWRESGNLLLFSLLIDDCGIQCVQGGLRDRGQSLRLLHRISAASGRSNASLSRAVQLTDQHLLLL